jgi:hypothetical protein
VAERYDTTPIQAQTVAPDRRDGSGGRIATFHRGQWRVLMAPFVVRDMDAAVNADLPNRLHSPSRRIARTAPTDADGVAIPICNPEEVRFERLTRTPIPGGDRHSAKAPASFAHRGAQRPWRRGGAAANRARQLPTEGADKMVSPAGASSHFDHL